MATGDDPKSLSALWQELDYDSTFSFASSEVAGSALDLDFQCDDSFTVRRVLVEPSGLRAHGRSVLDSVASSDRQQLRQAVERVSKDGGIERLRVRLNFGDYPHILLGVAQLTGPLPVGVSGLLLSDSDKSMYGSNVDELSLYRHLFERLPVSVFFKDSNGMFVGVNQRMVRRLGAMSHDEILGESDSALCSPDDAELYLRDDKHVIETGDPLLGITETRTRDDGSVEVLHTSKYPVVDRRDKIVGLMGFNHDITEPTALVEALTQSEQRYALAARATRDGIWDFDLNTGEVVLSSRCSQLLELPPTSDPVPWKELSTQIVKEDVRPLTDEVQGLRDNPDGFLHHTFRVIRKDGAHRWVEMSATPLVIDGQVARIIGSAADITDEREKNAELEFLATHDSLTGLGNRRALSERVETVLGSGDEAGLLMLDLDYFKVINDSLGHQAGDEVLEQISSRLQSILDPAYLMVRLGGDEFAVLIANRSRAKVLRTASAVANVIRKRMTISGLDLFMTASMGVVYVDESHEDADQLLRDADIALYEAKADGKSRIRVFEKEMRVAADAALGHQMSIRKAVHNNDFSLLYQPIINARTDEMSGVETLLRLAPEDGPVKSPAEFLPYLEQTDLIVEVGEWVMESAFTELAAWREGNLVEDNFTMAINVSRKQFQSERLANYVLRALDRFGIEGRNIILEITETAVLNNNDTITGSIDRLREAGVRIAIDDFGTGQSSLAVLHDLAVDILKIDKSFTDRILTDGDEPVITAALHVARSMGLITVAEGVEHEHQAEWLRAQHCDLLQGYLFSRPIDAKTLLEDLQWRALQ